MVDPDEAVDESPLPVPGNLLLRLAGVEALLKRLSVRPGGFDFRFDQIDPTDQPLGSGGFAHFLQLVDMILVQGLQPFLPVFVELPLPEKIAIAPVPDALWKGRKSLHLFSSMRPLFWTVF